jgi:acylglycerol lipase
MTVESVYRPIGKIVESQGKFKVSDGFQLFYRRWSLGGETERVVLGLHGAGWYSGQFRQMGAQLPVDVPGTELYAVDRRGFGDSVEDGFQRGDVSSFKRYLLDIDEVAESFRKKYPDKKFYLFGHSLGCTHALRFTLNHPDLVDGLILAAPPALLNFKEVKHFRRLLLRVMFLRVFSPRTMIDGTKYMSEATKQSEVTTSMQEDPLSAQNKLSVRYGFGFSRFMGTTVKNSRGVRAPTLILQGDADRGVRPEGATRLLEALSSSDKSLKTFPGADHHFYDSLLPRANSKYDDATRRQVYDSIADWLKTH